MNNEERNAFVERRYDELRMEGKHGHYECLFRVVHEIVDAELARVREELFELLLQSAPNCEPTDTAFGLITQLSNYIAGERERTERVARRAYKEGYAAGYDSKPMNEDEAVAQAMREEG